MLFINICNRIIEYSFYALFFFVPLAFASDTFELFEFNKMWLTFILTIIIAASWFIKMIRQSRIFIQRTPLDIPIALFLISQVISTIFSWDTHVSIWGYYSRFNGGLLSIISYIFLYYAFVSNLATVSMVKRLLFVSLISGTVVALWGLPSHFGYDPTCFLFRGSLDVSCWTADFQPMVRIFSTLGQPDWLAAYLAILIPISIAFAIKNSKSQAPNPKQYPMTKNQNTKRKSFDQVRLGFENSNLKNWNLFRIWNLGFGAYLLLSILFYLDLLYTGARSGVLAAWFSLAFFFILYLWFQRKKMLQSSKFSVLSSKLLLVFVILAFITFFTGQPFSQLEKFTLEGIKKNITNTQSTKNVPSKPPIPQKFAGELGGTDSGKIRQIVWQGAIDAWRHYPIFGTGVETFAFAYYRFRPEAHNLTSEWNFLYNKAHNEYLNYLATTGAFGLGTYLLMIGWFIFIFFKRLNPKSEIRNPKQYQNSNDKNSKPSLTRSKHFEHSNFDQASPENLSFDYAQDGELAEPFRVSIFEFRILNVALLASYISILVTNFFGFSVVITNIYLFLIPAFVFVLTGVLSSEKRQSPSDYHITPWLWTFIVLIILVALYMLTALLRFWNADKAYALGSNLDKAGEYQSAYPKLQEAVIKRDGEPVFKDELAVNNAILASALMGQEETKTSTDTASLAGNLAQDAITLNNFITSRHPNNIIFWKSRVRIFYALSQVDNQYLPMALEAVKKAAKLAPTDANISYNLAVLYGQNNDVENGIKTLGNTIRLKPDYRDAYYALGLFYHDQAVDDNGKVVDREKLDKAIEQLQYILENLGEEDKIAKETLEQWKKL